MICSSGGVNVGKLTEMGIRHYCIPDITEKEPSKIFIVAKKLKRIIKEEKITVIHTHHRMAAFYVSVLGLYKKCIFINTSHNTIDNKRRFTQISYKHCNLIACGEMVKKNLVEEFNLPSNRITVIHNAVRPFNNEVCTDRLIQELHDEGLFIIGNVGRLTEQKGMRYFIEAAPFIIKTHPDTRFLIIGSGEEEEMLKKMVSDNKMDKYILFLGYRNDIQNLMSQLDLVVLSSLWEGLPLTPIEAYSVEKTIVATAVDGTIEIVRDGIDGYLVEPGSAEAIADKVNYIIEHPNIKVALEHNAGERYKEKFSFTRLADSYIRYYERL